MAAQGIEHQRCRALDVGLKGMAFQLFTGIRQGGDGGVGLGGGSMATGGFGVEFRIDNKTLDSLKKNKNITLITLEKLCRILDCTPNDIVRFIDD